MLTLIFAPGRGLPLGPNAHLLLELATLGKNTPALSAQLPLSTLHAEGPVGQLVDVTGEKHPATVPVHLKAGELRIGDTVISHPMLLLITGRRAA